MSDPVLHIAGLTKRFGATIASNAVDMALAPGSVTGLVGENGAGKSTLLNMLSGLIQPDAGTMSLAGRPYRPASFAEAQALGVSRVFQEQSLIGQIPVYENLMLGHERKTARAGQVLRRRALIEAAQAIADEAGLKIDVRRRTDDFSFSQRQLIEIARACLGPAHLFGHHTPVVLLDEPTASLERADERVFFALVEAIRDKAALLFVSHRLSEVLTICDKIVVLKDGARVAEVAPDAVDERELHRLMVGRERNRDYYHEDRQQNAPQGVALSVTGLTRHGLYETVSLEVAPGEILGIGGLLESGKEAFGKGLAGVAAPDAGTVRVDGGAAMRPEIAAFIAAGGAYVPAERLREAMIAEQPLAWNMTLPSRDLFADRAGFWRNAKERATARDMIARLGIKTPGALSPCNRMSGGNQQKVVLARWLLRDLKVLVLDNPTRGVDAGAKEEIYRLIRDLTDEGVAIVLISDELLELIGLSNRIAIMRHGRIAQTVNAPANDKPGERALVEIMLSDERAQVVA